MPFRNRGTGCPSGRHDVPRAFAALRRQLEQRRRIGGLPRSTVIARRRLLATSRRFGSADLERLERLLDRAAGVIPIADVVRPGADQSPRLIVMRHDTDSDIENARRFAEWEAARGYRSTYFVLHSDWYYRDGDAGPPARFVLRVLDRIATLGHEIGVHNNAVSVALRTGRDSTDILAEEIDHLRRRGFRIEGTVAHGDPLCTEGRYNNGEVFLEAPRPELGSPGRTITVQDPASGHRLSTVLRPVSMSSLGLTYEANFIDNRHYLTDSHGSWSRPFDDIESEADERDGFLNIVVHPVWWALSGEVVRE